MKCVVLVEVEQADPEVVREYVSAVMEHADVLCCFDGGAGGSGEKGFPELNKGSTEGSYQAATFKFDDPGIVRENALRNGVRSLNDVEKAWVAAVIDGEGSILVAKIAPRHGH